MIRASDLGCDGVVQYLNQVRSGRALPPTADPTQLFSFAADLSRLKRSRVPNFALAGTLEVAKWDNSFAKL
jgi:hypothetical protein